MTPSRPTEDWAVWYQAQEGEVSRESKPMNRLKTETGHDVFVVWRRDNAGEGWTPIFASGWGEAFARFGEYRERLWRHEQVRLLRLGTHPAQVEAERNHNTESKERA